MSRLQNRIASAIASAASDANCCDCYSESAAQAVMAVLIRNGVIPSDPETLKLDREVKAERKRRDAESKAFWKKEKERSEAYLNMIDPNGRRHLLKQLNWFLSGYIVSDFEAEISFHDAEGTPRTFRTPKPKLAFELAYSKAMEEAK